MIFVAVVEMDFWERRMMYDTSCWESGEIAQGVWERIWVCGSY
jgi:hypothetical protein